LVLLAMVGWGCVLDPKTVGQADDGAASASAGCSESGGGDASNCEAESSGGSDGSASATGSASGSASGESGACDHEGCPWEPCAGLACGAFCNTCAPWDTECAEPGTFTVCVPSGECEIWPQWDQDPCPGTGLQPGFESTLQPAAGCGDMHIYAANADDTVALRLQLDGIVAEAHDAGMPIERTYAADDPLLGLEVTFGSQLTVLDCNDAPVGEPDVQEHWVASAAEVESAGEVTITVTPDGPDNEGHADVTITDLVISRDDADVLDPPITAPSIQLFDVYVGWLPG
jgi:hypothetical protein